MIGARPVARRERVTHRLQKAAILTETENSGSRRRRLNERRRELGTAPSCSAVTPTCPKVGAEL